jgi:ankyrin repeat protein
MQRSEIALAFASDDATRQILRTVSGEAGGDHNDDSVDAGAADAEMTGDADTHALHELLRAGVKANNVEQVTRALDSGGSGEACGIDDLFTEGCSCLHLACVHGFLDIAALLIANNATVDVRSAQADTPLHYATFANHESVVELLLDNGADPTITNDEHCSCIDVASDPYLKDLLERRYAERRREEDADDAQAPSEQEDEDEDDDHDEPVVEAKPPVKRGPGRPPGGGRGGRGRGSAAKIRRTRKANLKAAVASSSSSSAAAAAPTKEETAGVAVCEVPLVLDDTLREEIYALHEVIKQGNADLVRREVANVTPTHLNAPDSLGRSALHVCAQYNQLETAKVVLAAGADVNRIGPRNSTPLHLAAEAGHAAMVKLLLTSGADRDLVNAAGITPFGVSKDSAVAAIFTGAPPPPSRRSSTSSDAPRRGSASSDAPRVKKEVIRKGEHPLRTQTQTQTHTHTQTQTHTQTHTHTHTLARPHHSVFLLSRYCGVCTAAFVSE